MFKEFREEYPIRVLSGDALIQFPDGQTQRIRSGEELGLVLLTKHEFPDDWHGWIIRLFGGLRITMNVQRDDYRKLTREG